MRGEVLHYDKAHGFGFITGEDGNRYTFRREDLKRPFQLSKGTVVEFRESGDQARDVSPPLASTQVSAPAPAEAPPRPVRLTATPIATPTAQSVPQRYGRNAVGDSEVAGQASTGLWSYFWATITTNYANFHGRARRKEYWGFGLFYVLGMILLTIAGLAIDAATGNLDYGVDFPIMATTIIVLPAFLASLVPGIAITVRRFHDIGLSGWFYLLMWVIGFLLAGVVMIMAVVLGLIPSQRRENKWGPVPDGVEVPPLQ
jgi:uncharacterized membrane protein YhaH (DUF805 family)/cold shock CspA family protein